MSKPDRRIDIEEISGVTVARLLEKKILDEANIEALGQELFALVDKDGRKKIVLDFTLVEYLSSAALGKLITMHKKVTTAKGKLALCSIQKDILDVFKITQLNKVLTLCTNLDEALTIKNTAIAQELSLPPVKIHCSMLAEDAIKAAIQDYKNKQESDDA